ncbi:MAG: hypothetical protein IT382_13565 [Deltaproteobacteria bacterium]|nr:hypothetical protein [Deltaproteobacteria bacterium]
MAFRREATARAELSEDELTEAMTGIGMSFAAHADHGANIEDTLLAASEQGMLDNDLRTLAVLVTWLGVHARLINADRLVRLVEAHDAPRVCAFWAAFASWQKKDRRFARLIAAHEGERVDLLSVGTDFQVKRHGEDPRFEGSALRVPANTLRDRASDVLDPEELARRHRAYRQRLVMGPSYRADMWAVLDENPSLSAAELARAAHGSFATAWQVKRDWHLVASARAKPLASRGALLSQVRVTPKRRWRAP